MQEMEKWRGVKRGRYQAWKGKGVGQMGKYVEGKKDGFLFGGVYYIFC